MQRSWRSRSRVLKNFVAHNWQRAFILAALIVLIVLISVKVENKLYLLSACCPAFTGS